MSKYAGFNSVQLTKPKRSQFDLSHTKRLTTRMGRLTPVFVNEAIPGDTFRGNIEILLRAAPLLAPLYEMITLYVHIFFVPYRIIWAQWEEFITGGRLGVGVDPVTAPIPPYYTFAEVLDPDQPLLLEWMHKSSLMDYLGMPILVDMPGYTYAAFETAGEDARFELLVPAAYQKIWDDYYRDRNFIPDDNVFPMNSGHQDLAYAEEILPYRLRCWEHDYFTSALPTTQRGQEVLMPLAGSGSVTYLDESFALKSPPIGGPAAGPLSASVDPGGPIIVDSANPTQIINIDEVLLDSSNVSINDFRVAYAMQVWLERNEVAGSRYNESSLAHFGVKPQDSRLQRAEYLGGGRIPVKISEVVSTAYSDDGDAIVPLANMAGHGITYGNTNSFRYFVAEHGVILGIASIMSPPSYHQGMPRWFNRRTFLDYPWPTFASLGEQTVHRFELFASAINLTEDAAGNYPEFGYQSRYADWKHQLNTNHGDFHDDLLFWSLTNDFQSSPVLGADFTQYNTQLQNRIFAVNGDQDTDNWWLYIHNNVTVNRCLPYFGTPNTLGFS